MILSLLILTKKKRSFGNDLLGGGWPEPSDSRGRRNFVYRNRSPSAPENLLEKLVYGFRLIVVSHEYFGVAERDLDRVADAEGNSAA